MLRKYKVKWTMDKVQNPARFARVQIFATNALSCCGPESRLTFTLYIVLRSLYIKSHPVTY